MSIQYSKKIYKRWKFFKLPLDYGHIIWIILYIKAQPVLPSRSWTSPWTSYCKSRQSHQVVPSQRFSENSVKTSSKPFNSSMSLPIISDFLFHSVSSSWSFSLSTHTSQFSFLNSAYPSVHQFLFCNRLTFIKVTFTF